MKYLSKKNLKKLIIAIITVLMLNFITPCQNVNASVGGVLLSPLIDLTTFLGDVVMGVIQYSCVGSFTVKLEFDNKGAWTGDLELPIIRVSPEEIFLNQIPLFDVNFINPMPEKVYKNFEEDGTSIKAIDDSKRNSVAGTMRDTLAKWYVAFRNISIIILLSVLIYIGIKIVLSTAEGKAKYKEYLMDWVIGLVLIFVLHFFMVFTLAITQTITEGLSAKNNPITIDLSKIKNAKDIKLDNLDDKSKEALQDYAELDGSTVTKWKVNYMGYVRFYVEYWRVAGPDAADENQTSSTGNSNVSTSTGSNAKKSNNDELPVLKSVSYLIIYIALVIITVRFVFSYLKRVLTMALLTVIAPLMGLMYPIDKFGDGKAQGFQTWFKSYVMNALIQPFDLIIYTIIMSSVIDLAKESPIYAVVAMGSIIPLENLMKELFQIDKRGGKHAGAMNALVGLNAAQTLKKNLPKVSNLGLGKGGSGKGDNKLDSGTGSESKIKYANTPNNDVGIEDFLNNDEAKGGSIGTGSTTPVRTQNPQAGNDNLNGGVVLASGDNSNGNLGTGSNQNDNSNTGRPLIDENNVNRLNGSNQISGDNSNVRSASKVPMKKKLSAGAKTAIRSLTGTKARKFYRVAGAVAGTTVGAMAGAGVIAASGGSKEGIGIAAGMAIAGNNAGVKLANSATDVAAKIPDIKPKESMKKLGDIGRTTARNIQNDYLDQIEDESSKNIRYQNQQKADFIRDSSVQKFMTDKYKDANLSSDEIKTKLNTAAELKANGIDDIEQIGNGLDLVDYNMKQFEGTNMSEDEKMNRAIKESTKVAALSSKYSEKDLTVNREDTRDAIKEKFEKKVSRDAVKDEKCKKDIADIQEKYKIKKEKEGIDAEERAKLASQEKKAINAAKESYIDKAKEAQKDKINKKTDELMNSLDIMKGIKKNK